MPANELAVIGILPVSPLWHSRRNFPPSLSVWRRGNITEWEGKIIKKKKTFLYGSVAITAWAQGHAI